MEWVRGGHWYPARLASPNGAVDPGTMDDGRRAYLIPFASDGDRGEMLCPLYIPLPELDRSAWWAEVGRPAALVPYGLTPALANDILASLQAFVAEFPFDPDPFVEPPLAPDDALCELLERFGPLEALPGVVPEPLSPDDTRTVTLRSFHAQLAALASAYTEIGGKVGERNRFSESLADASSDALQDVTVYVRFEPAGVVFDPQPRSLRAYLWRHVLGCWGRSPYRFCKLCKTLFAVPYGPGKPPLYCEDHRNSRSRKQAERLAPPNPTKEQ